MHLFFFCCQHFFWQLLPMSLTWTWARSAPRGVCIGTFCSVSLSACDPSEGTLRTVSPLDRRCIHSPQGKADLCHHIGTARGNSGGGKRCSFFKIHKIIKSSFQFFFFFFPAHLFSLCPNNCTNSHFRILYTKRQHTQKGKLKHFNCVLDSTLHPDILLQEMASFWQEINSISNGLWILLCFSIFVGLYH